MSIDAFGDWPNGDMYYVDVHNQRPEEATGKCFGCGT